MRNDNGGAARDVVYGRMRQVTNSKSDNKSDKKNITEDQYEVVGGCKRCRSSVKGKAGEYAVKGRLIMWGSATEMEICACGMKHNHNDNGTQGR